MKLDHPSIPGIDKEASARFFAKIVVLEFVGIHGTSGPVRVDEALTLHFDERQTGRMHLAFHVTNEEFDAVLGRLKADGVAFGTTGGRTQAFDMQVGTHNGGRRVYFDDPNGQNFELMTVGTNDGR